MTLTLPYPPSTNRLWRTAKGGRTVMDKSAKTWKQQAAWCARAAGVPLLDGPVAVAVTLHPRLTAKGKPSKARIDLDNAIKGALDALQGLAYNDDNQVVRLSAELGYPIPDGGLTVQVMAV